ncbi:MAG: hypothetical protein AAF318_15440 [Pseudomonadota bacterium]
MPSPADPDVAAKRVARLLLAALFAAAGVFHFTHTADFAALIAWLPAPGAIVWATGAVELLLAAALLTARWRKAAGVALALYALAVLPANIAMALDPALHRGFPEWALWLRVVLQAPLVALILWASR